MNRRYQIRPASHLPSKLPLIRRKFAQCGPRSFYFLWEEGREPPGDTRVHTPPAVLHVARLAAEAGADDADLALYGADRLGNRADEAVGDVARAVRVRKRSGAGLAISDRDTNLLITEGLREFSAGEAAGRGRSCR